MYEIYCKLRDERGVRDADVAKTTGISKSTFSDWKSGRSKPKNEKLKKIADYFGVTIKYLMTGKEDSGEQKITSLSQTEELDIMKDVDVIIDKLKKVKKSCFVSMGKKLMTKELNYLENPY